MISAMTGIPVMAAPIAAPRIACSEIGVSRMRSGPELVEQADGRLEHSSRAGDVLTEHHEAGVASHLLGDAVGNGFAIGQFRHAEPPSAQTSVIKCSSPWDRSAGLGELGRLVDPPGDVLCDRAQSPSGTPRRSKALVIHRDRVPLHPGLHLAGGTVFAGSAR